MNVQHIFNEIEKVDPEVYDKLDSRRNVMQRFSFIGKTLALAAVPSALGAMFKKAYGQSTSTIVDVLNFALTLEYLESEFYKAAVTLPIIPANDMPAWQRIKNDEVAHVADLRTVITSLGGTPVTKTAANFDFTGGKGSGNGPFKPAFTNYAVLLAAAQTFEDTGVRAYKGQAGNLMSNNDVLTAALQIHSVEARHAAKVRMMRRELNQAIPAGVTVQPWITLNQSGIDFPAGQAAIQKSYDAGNGADFPAESNTTQAGVSIVNIGGNTIAAAEASESFDEALDKAKILEIVDPFLVP